MKLSTCGSTPFLLVAALCGASLLLQASTLFKRQWDWNQIRKDRSVGQVDKFDGYTFVPFVFEDTSQPSPNKFNGFEITKDDQSQYIEVEDAPDQFGSWELVAKPKDMGGTFDIDIDGDGVNEIVVRSTRSDGTSAIRVFSLGESLNERGCLSTVKRSFVLAPVIDDRGKVVLKLLADPIAPDKEVYLLVAGPGSVYLQNFPHSSRELIALNRAQQCLDAWRSAKIWGQAASQDWVSECDDLLANKPGDADLLAVRAAVYSIQYPVAMDKSEADARAAISKKTDCALAHAVLGHILDIRQKYKEAAAEFSEAIKTQPENPHWYANRALAYEGLGEFDQSIADYATTITLDPNSDWAYASRAHAHLSKKDGNPGADDIDRAIADIDKALALNSKNSYALKQRADAHAKKGSYKEAIADLKTAEGLLSKDDPELVEIFDMQARFWEQLGNKEEAAIATEKCNKLTNQINSKP